MTPSESAALDSYQLMSRVLGGLQQADTHTTLLGRVLQSPLVPRWVGSAGLEPGRLRVVDAEHLLSDPLSAASGDAIALLRPDKMGELMPQVRRLNELGVAAIGLDLAPLADSPPYGRQAWRPRTREELAELRGAIGVPLWIFSVGSPADADIAAEAGADAVVVDGATAVRLGSPAAIDLLPEIIDAVGGMLSVLSGGPVRDGIDVLRYLAVGAEALVIASDRELGNLEAELRYAMRLTGCAGLEDIGYDIIFTPLFEEP